MPLLIHLAETEDEVKAARERGGMSPTGYLESLGFWPAPHAGGARRVGLAGRHHDPRQARCRHLPQSREQHEAGQRHGAGDRRIWPPAWPSVSAPTARRATTTSTCSRPCARRRSSHKHASRDPRAVPAHDRARDGHYRRRPSARHGGEDRLARGRQAGRPHHRRHERRRGRRRCTIRCRTSSTRRAATTSTRRS